MISFSLSWKEWTYSAFLKQFYEQHLLEHTIKQFIESIVVEENVQITINYVITVWGPINNLGLSIKQYFNFN